MKQLIYRDMDFKPSGGTKKSIQTGSENYACQVIKVKELYPIEGADKIVRTVINGTNVIVSKDVKPGDLMLLFVAMTKLSEELCHLNNLYDKPELNADPTKKGFINSKSRVRALKLKGIVSDGLLLPLEALSYIPVDLKEGDEFTHVGDTLICEKYFVPERNSNPGGKAPKKDKMEDLTIPGQIRFHHETAHLAKNSHKISLNDEIVITDKLHGSSCILGKVKVKRKLSFVEKAAKFFGVKVVETEYAGIWSSGKPKSSTIKGCTTGWKTKNPSYYTADVWKQAYDDFEYAIEPGITIYGELLAENIQKKYDYTKLRPEGKSYSMVVYRITRTNDEGLVDEFSWNQLEEYCAKYNLTTVPVIYKGTVDIWLDPNGKITPAGYEGEEAFVPDLRGFVEALTSKYLEVKCKYCVNDVWAEGICVRREKPYDVFKLKSKNFILGESEAQEQGETNIEDEQ